MIAITADSHRLAPGIISRQQITTPFCGSDCVFRDLPESAVFGQNGADPSSVAACDGEKVWLNLSSASHPPSHLLHLGLSSPRDGVGRAELVRRVKCARPAGVVTVLESCSCGLELQFAEGGVFKGAGRTPDWAMIFAPDLQPSDGARPMSREACFRYLADLALGLANLHQLGIAHRDPFPFNAAIHRGRCVWIDLNSCEPLDEQRERLDVLAFFHFCFTTVLCSLRPVPVAAIEAGLSLFEQDSPAEVLKGLAQLSARVADDEQLTAGSMVDIGFRERYRTVLQKWSGVLDWCSRITFDHALVYLDFLWNEGQARIFQHHLRLERKRHLLAEQEFARTNRDRHRVAELEAWNLELQQGKDWLEQQMKLLEVQSTQQEQRIKELQAWIAEREEAIAWQKGQIETLQAERTNLSATLADRMNADRRRSDSGGKKG